jgi:hypothetical protein
VRAGPVAALRPVATLALALGALALSVRPAGACRPTLDVVTVDGSFQDWEVTLTNPVNVTQDFQGLGGQSPDRDRPVSSAYVDISRFAWTYDNTNLYVFLERYGASTQQADVWIHLDLDMDGLMEASDKLVQFRLGVQGVAAVAYTLFEFDPSPQPSQAMVDGMGSADGFAVGGRQGAQLVNDPSGHASANLLGTTFEGRIPWAELGVPAASCVNFHVSTSFTSGGPASGEDNCGAPDDGMGTTCWVDLTVALTSRSITGVPGTYACFEHQITFAGNLPNSYADIHVTTDSVDPVPIELDEGTCAAFVRRLGTDAEADDVWDTYPSDTPPANMIPDTGPVTPPATFDFRIRSLVPPLPQIVDANLTVRVEVPGDDCAKVTVVDRLVSGELTLAPPRNLACVLGGQALRFAHELCNKTTRPLTVDIKVSSSLGLPYTVCRSSNPCDGSRPCDLGTLTDTNMDPQGLPDTLIMPGACLCVVAQSVAPFPMPGEDLRELADIEASVLGDTPLANIHDEAAFSATSVKFSADHLRATGTNGYVGPGGIALYPHRFQNCTSSSCTVSFERIGTDPGFQSRIFTDPNCDGDSADGDGYVDFSLVPAAANGGEVCIVVRMSALPTVAVNAVDTTAIRASSTCGGAIDNVDETVVSKLITYGPPPFLSRKSTFLPCETVHVVAYALQADTDHLIEWYDQTGSVVYTTPVFRTPTGPPGSVFNWDNESLTLPPDAQGTWQVAVYTVGAMGSRTQIDRESFTIENGGLRPSTAPASTPQEDCAPLEVSYGLVNTNPTLPMEDCTLAITLKDAAGTTYYDGATWQPYAGDPAEVTRTLSLPDIAAMQNYIDSIILGSVDYPSTPGPYEIDYCWNCGCTTLDGCWSTWAGPWLVDVNPAGSSLDPVVQPTAATTIDDCTALTVDYGLENLGASTALGCNVSILIRTEDGTQYYDGSSWLPYTGTEVTRVVPPMPPILSGSSEVGAEALGTIDYPTTPGRYVVDYCWACACASATSCWSSRQGAWTITVNSSPSNCGMPDPCIGRGATLPRVTGLRVRKAVDDVVLTWDDLPPDPDGCLTYTVFFTEDKPIAPVTIMATLGGASGLTAETASDPGEARTTDGDDFRAYLVQTFTPGGEPGPNPVGWCVDTSGMPPLLPACP